MASKKVIVPIGFQFDDISSELDRVKKGLSGIKLDSNLGEQYSKSIRAAEKEIERLQSRAARGVSSQSEIDGFNNGLNSLLDNLKRIQNLSGKIKFNNLNLDASQLNKLRSLQQALENSKKAASTKKLGVVNNFFSDKDSGFAKTMKEGIGLTQEAFNSYESFNRKVNEGIKGLQNTQTQQQTNLDLIQQQIKAYKELNDVSNSNNIISQANVYGKQDKNGKWSFKTNQAEAGRAALVQWGQSVNVFSNEDAQQILAVKSSLGDIIKKFEELRAAKEQAALTEENSLTKDLEATKSKIIEVSNAFGHLQKALSAGTIQEQEAAVENAQKALDEYKAALVAAAQAQQNNNTNLDTSTGKVQSFKEKLADTRKELENMQSAEAIFSNMAFHIKQLTGITAVFSQVRRGVQEAVSQIRELDSAMNGIAVVTDMTNAELWGQINTYMSIAKQYGVTTQGTYQVSQLYYQMGLDANSVMELTTQTLKMAKIANIEYADATDYLTTAMNGFGLSASDAGTIVDVYSKLASIAATDTQELAEAMSRTAAIASSAGMSLQSTSAMLTQMIEQTREPAESLGTALKTIIARFQEMKSNPTELLEVDGDAASLNKMDTALASVGISLKDATGQFRDLDEVVFELSEIWDTLDRNTQRWIANTAAGSRQQSRFVALLSDNERLQELYTAALDSEDAALVQYAASLDSLDSKLNQLSTSFQQFYMQIANGETFKGLLDLLSQAIDNLSQMGSAGAAILVAAFISSFQAIGLAATAAISNEYKTIKETIGNEKNEIGSLGDEWWARFAEKLVPTVKSKVEEAKDIVEAAAKGENTTTPRTNIGNSSGSTTDSASASTKIKTVIGAASKIVPIITLISSGLSTVLNKSNSVQVAFSRFLSVTQALGGVAQIATGHYVTGIMTILSALTQLINSEESAIERLNRLSKASEKANIKRAESKQTLTNLDSTYKKYIRLRDAQYESNEAYEEWISFNQQVINDYPTLASTYDSQKNLIADLASAYEDLKEKADSAYQYQKRISQNADTNLADDALYKFSQYGIDTSNKNAAESYSLLGAAKNQAEIAKILFEDLFPQENYADSLAHYSIFYGNTSPFDFPNQDMVTPRDRSYVAAQLYNLVNANDEKFQSMLEDTQVSETIDELVNSLSITRDALIEVLRNYDRIIQAGQEKLYSNAQTNIQDLKNNKEFQEIPETLQTVILNYLQQKLEVLQAQGAITGEEFTTSWSSDNIINTLNEAYAYLQEQYAQLTEEQITQIESISSSVSSSSFLDWNKLTEKQQQMLEEVYGITSQYFIERIDRYTQNIREAIRSSNVEGVPADIYDILEQVPVSLMGAYSDNLIKIIQSDKISNLGGLDKYTELISGLLSETKEAGLTAGDLSTLFTDADFTTRSGWLDFLDALTASGKQGAELAKQFNEWANTIPITLADAEQGVQSYQKKYSTAAENLKNLTSSDFDKREASYSYFFNLGASATDIEAVMLGEDINGEIQQKLLNLALQQQRDAIDGVIEELKNNPEQDQQTIAALEAQLDFIDAAMQETVGTRATSTVQLLKKLYEGAGGDSVVLDQNDFNRLINDENLKGLEKYFEKTGINTWGLKAGISYVDFLTDVLNLINNSNEDNIGLLQNVIKGTEAKTKKSALEADFANAFQPLINSAGDSGEIVFDKNTLISIGNILGDKYARMLASSMDDSLAAITGEYSFIGTIKELFDMIEAALIEMFGVNSEQAQAWSAYRAKNEYGLNQSRIYYQAEQELNKVHAPEESIGGMADILINLKDFAASSDDATEAIKRFGLTAEDFVKDSQGKYSLSGAGASKISSKTGTDFNKTYNNRAELEKEISRLQKDIVSKQSKELELAKATLAVRKKELKVLNEKQLKVAENADDYNTLIDQPEEFAENVMSYGDALKELSNTGYIEIRTLSNLINNLGDGSETLKAIGEALDVPADKAGDTTAVIDALYNSTKKLATIDGKAVVQLGSAVGKALTQAGSVDLTSVAKSNIKMLDGMIATLEAMAELQNFDGELSIADKFGLNEQQMNELNSYVSENLTTINSIDQLFTKMNEVFGDNEQYWIDFSEQVQIDPQNIVASLKQVVDFINSNPSYAQQLGEIEVPVTPEVQEEQLPAADTDIVPIVSSDAVSTVVETLQPLVETYEKLQSKTIDLVISFGESGLTDLQSVETSYNNLQNKEFSVTAKADEDSKNTIKLADQLKDFVDKTVSITVNVDDDSEKTITLVGEVKDLDDQSVTISVSEDENNPDIDTLLEQLNQIPSDAKVTVSIEDNNISTDVANVNAEVSKISSGSKISFSTNANAIRTVVNSLSGTVSSVPSSKETTYSLKADTESLDNTLKEYDDNSNSENKKEHQITVTVLGDTSKAKEAVDSLDNSDIGINVTVNNLEQLGYEIRKALTPDNDSNSEIDVVNKDTNTGLTISKPQDTSSPLGTLVNDIYQDIDEGIPNEQTVEIKADTEQYKEETNNAVTETEDKNPTIKVGSNTVYFQKGVDTSVNNANNKFVKIPIYGEDYLTESLDEWVEALQERYSVPVNIIPNYNNYNTSYNASSRDGIGGSKAPRNTYSSYASGATKDGVPTTGTALVGELGPELVVSDNKYRVVGQYGAEFVNLSRGDIVFNASDTARIMKGQTGAHGVAFANGAGPAYASGLDSAINSLKEARAAWSSILNSVPDMLKKGSGSGSGSSDDTDKEYLMQLEKWFNWLRRIEELENRITVLRAKRENLKDGKEYAQSLYEENAYLKKQSELYSGLLEEQKAYRKQLQEDYLKNYSKYFYFVGDAIQINADAILADTKNNEELGDAIQDLIDDYKDVTEQITDNTSKLEENQTQMDENIRTLRDKYIEMENEVLDALKNMYQQEIDNKQKALNEMKKADEAYLDSLRKNLDKEKNLREKSKTREEKETLQRKIALLSRDTSSASAQELAELRQQLREMQEEQYFTEREDAITSAEDAAQAQQDALQKEIDNLEEANQIKLDNMTLYWEEVANIINQGNENILSFLQAYGESYSEMSKIQQEDYTTTWKQTIDAALEYAKDMQKQFDEIIAAMTEEIRKSDTMTTGGLDQSSSSGGSDSSGSGSKKTYNNNNNKDNDKASNVVQDRLKQLADTAAKASKLPTGSSKGQLSNSIVSSGNSIIKKKTTTVKKYASGGLVNYTGTAWVDGTPSRPEAFLSADDTELLKNFLQAARGITVGLSSSTVRNNAATGSPTVNVDNVEINITQASLKDDDDLNKLSQDLSQKFLMDIARQSGNISISRR